MNKSSVYFASLGCPKNLVDSQVMLGILDKEGMKIVQEPSEAEVIIINTCAFIEASKAESIDTILEMAEHKETGKCEILVASGCLTQRYSKELEKDLPEVDLFIGTGQYHLVAQCLREHRDSLANGQPPKRTYVDQPAFIHSDADPRMLTGYAHSAFLKISEGCNRRCAFCIIPKLRGNVRSRSIDSLVAETEQLASKGVREINLVAQDLTEYGMEKKYRENLESLLPRLAAVSGIEWIRLHYVYPEDFSDELVDLIASEPKIVKYLDMPIQHTNDRVLSLMNRRLTKEKLFRLIRRLRDKVPGIVFRTSVIAGFPSETEEEFRQLVADLETLAFDHVGVFSYSREEGTTASSFDGQIPLATRRRRQRELETALEKSMSAARMSLVGQVLPALIEGASEDSDSLIQARISTQAREIDGSVLINDLGGLPASSIHPGLLTRVRITEVVGRDLVATLVNEGA